MNKLLPVPKGHFKKFQRIMVRPSRSSWLCKFFLLIFCSCAFFGYEIYMTYFNEDSQKKIVKELQINSQVDKSYAEELQEILDIYDQLKIESNQPSKLNIVILSSMPRSGSTMIGELVTTYSSDIKYYFEPDQYIEKNRCFNVTGCAVNFYSNLFSCNESSDFYSWYKKKRFFFKYYSDEAKKCAESEQYSTCVRSINLTNECESSNIQLIKNIRVRLSIFRELFKRNKHLKVIHLYRDPRGSLWSINRFKWHITEELRCQWLLDDLIVYNELEALYPDRIIQLSYDFFSTDPLTETQRLFTFLFNTTTLPESAEKYINEHLFTNSTVQGVMSTTKNSKSYYQSWRWKIEEPYLLKIENDANCKASIKMMGHELFKTLKNAHDINLSLFSEIILL